MRRLAIPLLWLAFFGVSHADVIHLKNGHTISADSVHQNGDKLEYEIGDDSYAIPMSSVDHIESGYAPSSSGITSATATNTGQQDSDLRHALPDAGSLLLEIKAVEAEAVRARVIRNGRVDRDAVAAIESTHDNHVIALAYDAIAVQMSATGDALTGERYLHLALALEPQHPILTAHYAIMLMGLHRYTEAAAWAGQATQLAPQDAGLWYLLGIADFLSDQTPRAIDAWKHSMALRPTAQVRQLLAKAQREQIVQADYRVDDSAHFTLHYEGGQTSLELRHELLATLESAFDELSTEFGFSPRGSIPVVVYNNVAFTAVTEAPAWSDGLNDGKLRIPVQNLQTLTPQVASVLKHELAHSFIGQASRDRCPQWLNEGIAELVQGRRSASVGPLLHALIQQNRWVSLSRLEGPFNGYAGGMAQVAYGESLAAAEVIRDSYGFGDLVRILQRIGAGMLPEEALRATIHSSYSDLDTEIQRHLQKQ